MWPAVPRIIARSRRAELVALPCLERAERTAVGEVLAEELAQQPLVRARLALRDRDPAHTGQPGTNARPRAGRHVAAARQLSRAAGAERAARRVREHRGLVGRDRRMTARAVVE